MLEAVIFDLDGLLIDSEPLQYRAYRDAFAEHNIALSQSDWHLWHELGASAATWIKHRFLDLDPELIRARKKLFYEELVEAELSLKPGARVLVEGIAKSGIRMCVASGSRIESIQKCLQKFDLLAHFEGMFSAVAVARKKPFPDVFIAATNELELDRDRAVVIEDSPMGLSAAIAAGIKCVVCPDSFLHWPSSAYQGATKMVDSLEHLDVDELQRVVD
jgi:beta-phosphoglucomutase